MGSDIYPVLGRTKRTPGMKRIGDLNEAFPCLEGLLPESFEFFRPDGDHKDSGVFPAYIHKCYPLFSWLGFLCGTTKPLEDHVMLKQHTLAFIAWLDQGKLAYSPLEDPDPETNFFIRYVQGMTGAWLYPLEYLRIFDYDRVATVWKSDADYQDPVTQEWFVQPIYGDHPEGKTYYELFVDSGWFEFLDVAQAQDWDFLICVFD